jgi:hypothetical protein
MRNFAIALVLLALVAVAVFITGNRPVKPPVIVRFLGFETNSIGYDAYFTATNISSHDLILELSTESLVDGTWTWRTLSGTVGFGIIPPHAQWRIHQTIPTNAATRRGFVDCIRIPRNKMLREIDIFWGTYFRKDDPKVRCYSDEFHVPPKS